MYRLLIADDEPLEREGLELMVQRAMPEQFTIYHAENGRAAIEKADQYQLDIIFMDIKMPGIQGLEAVSVIQTKLPHAKIVIVTAYDYFTYAKEAIALGVSEYILKPAKREQIVTLLQRLTREIAKNRTKRVQELALIEQVSHLRPLTENECALSLMLGTIQELDVATLSKIVNIDIQFGYAIVVSFPHMEDEAGQRRLFEYMKHYMKAQQDCLVSPIIQQHMVIFLPVTLERGRHAQQTEIFHHANKLRGDIKKQIAQSVYIGIGSIQKGAEGWRQSYNEALLTSSQGTNEAPVQVFFQDLQLGIIEEDKRLLCNAISMMDEQETISLLRAIEKRLIDKMKGNPKHIRIELSALFSYIEQFFKGSHFQYEPINLPDIDNINELQGIGEQHVVAIIQKLRKEGDKRASHLLMLARSYIDNNYAEDISLEQVAEYVNLNHVYFSKLFKKQMGETFSDYVMRLRIEKAKLLIKQGELSLKEICFQIGYRDPNYFSRVFKKYTNESPKEYRQRLLV